MRNLPGAIASIWTKRYPPRDARRKSLIEAADRLFESIKPDMQRIIAIEKELELLRGGVAPTLARIDRLHEMATRQVCG